MQQEATSVRSLSDRDLHQNLVRLKSKESHVVAEIICHLEEVFRRRLFADYHCSSIYDYCIQVLGYSNGEAHRKISACKLAAQIPEIRDSIATGEMSLSNAASVQSLVSKLQKASSANAADAAPSTEPELIRSIVERVKNKSSRACEKELSKIAEEFDLSRDTLRPTRRNIDERAQLKVSVNRDKLDQLKRELGISCEQELVEYLINEKLDQLQKAKEAILSSDVKTKAHKANAKPRSISSSKRAIVLKQAQGKCENCGSAYHLQIDHRECVAKGGGNNLSNLRVLCRSCNQRAAIEQLGLKKMDPYLNQSRTLF